MKNIKSIQICLLMFFAVEYTIIAKDHDQSSQQQVAYAPTQPLPTYTKRSSSSRKVVNKVATKNSSSITTTQPTKSRDKAAEEMEKLIEEFVQAVKDIPTKNSSRWDSPYSGEQDRKALRMYRAKVKNAYEKYKALYHYKPRAQITIARNEQIIKSLRKLYDCINVENMQWFGIVFKENTQEIAHTAGENTAHTMGSNISKAS